METIKENLLEVINEIRMQGEFPAEWKIGKISPILKKGNREEMRNYRGVTLIDTEYKIYTEMIRKRLEKELEEGSLLEETQMGFRRNRDTIEAIYALKTMINKELRRERGEIILCFADIRSAFDRLRREEIWRMMKKMGINIQTRERIEEIYEETMSMIEVDKETSESLEEGEPEWKKE